MTRALLVRRARRTPATLPPEPEKQTLVLENFPRPSVANVLSPNGRAHHMAKYRATQAVAAHVKVMATMDGLRPMRGLVTLRVIWIVPDRRRRDTDNHTTGVVKAAIDALVRGGYLEADDTDHLRLLPVEIRTEPGRRALVLEFFQ
jgi:Holliday junction resolvase RusA-like endonuclease